MCRGLPISMRGVVRIGIQVDMSNGKQYKKYSQCNYHD